MKIRNVLILAVLLLAAEAVARAQDRIVTVAGDTIGCRIVSVGSGHIVYENRDAAGNTVGKTIGMAQVAEYTRNTAKRTQTVYDGGSIDVAQLKPPLPKIPLLLAATGGGSWMPDGGLWGLLAGSDRPKFTNSLTQGFHLGASAHCLLFRFFGIGGEYSFFTSSAQGQIPIYTYPSTSAPIYFTGDVNYRQYINYAGLSFLFRQHIGWRQKLRFNESLSAGIMMFRGEMQTHVSGFESSPSGGAYFTDANDNVLIQARTFGFTVGVSVEYQVLPFLSVGISGSGNGGKASMADITEWATGSEKQALYGQKISDGIRLMRWDYSLMLRFNFK